MPCKDLNCRARYHLLKLAEDQRVEGFACNIFHMAHIVSMLDLCLYLQ